MRASSRNSDLQRFQVGDWTVDPVRDRIRSHKGSVTLRPKVMNMLVVLARHPLQVLTVEELLAAVWPDTVTSPASVYNCLKELRAALQDDPKAPRYIETIPKRGYRLIAPTKVLVHEETGRRVAGFHPTAPEVTETPNPWWKQPASAAAGLLLVLLATAFAVGWSLKPSTEPALDRSIRFVAVLPLNDVSREGSLDYLGEGFARAIIDELSQDSNLRIIAYESSSRFQDTRASERTIGKQLGADLLVTGTIDRSNDRIEVSIRMTDATSGEAVLSRTVSIPEHQLYLARSQMGDAVMAALHDSPPEVEPPGAPSPPRMLDNRAYDLYLRARRLVGSESKQALIDALELLEQVQRIEPGFGRAQALKVDAQSRLYVAFREGWPAGQLQDVEAVLVYQKSLLQEAERLVAEYPALAESHLLLGRMLRFSEQFDEARQALERALQLNPSLGEAHRELGWLNYESYGSLAQTADHFRQAVALDPYSAELRAVLVNGLSWIADAREEMWRVLDDTKQRLAWSPRISLSESAALLSEGRYADAIRVLEDALERSDDPRFRFNLAGTWYALDRADRSRQLEPGYASWRDNQDPSSLDAVNRCPSRPDQVEGELLLWAAYICADRRKPERVRKLLEARYPTPGELGAESKPMLGSEISAAMLLAWALKATGDFRTAETYADIEARVVNSRTENGALKSGKYFMLKARLAAVRGNSHEVFEYLNAMIEHGQLDPRPLAHPVFDDYRNLPGFKELLRKRSERVRAQLEQLGLATTGQFAAAESQ